jgi:hypothetical protein
MNDHLLACQQIFETKESYIVNRFANKQALFLNLNDINDISFFGTPVCHHCCSIALSGNANSMGIPMFFEIKANCSAICFMMNGLLCILC